MITVSDLLYSSLLDLVQLTLSTYPVCPQADHDFWNTTNTWTHISSTNSRFRTGLKHDAAGAFKDAVTSDSIDT